MRPPDLKFEKIAIAGSECFAFGYVSDLDLLNTILTFKVDHQFITGSKCSDYPTAASKHRIALAKLNLLLFTVNRTDEECF